MYRFFLNNVCFVEKQISLKLLKEYEDLVQKYKETVEKCKEENSKNLLNYQEETKILKENNDILVSQLNSKIKLLEEQLTVQSKESNVSCENNNSISENNKNNNNSENNNCLANDIIVTTKTVEDVPTNDEKDINDFLTKISKYANKRLRDEDDDEFVVFDDSNNSTVENFTNCENDQSVSENDVSISEKPKKKVHKLTFSSNITRIVSPYTDSDLLNTHTDDYIGIVDKTSKKANNIINSDSSSSNSDDNNSNAKEKNKIHNINQFSAVSEKTVNTNRFSKRPQRKRRQTEFYANRAIDRQFFVAQELKNEDDD